MVSTNSTLSRWRALYIRHRHGAELAENFRLNQDEWVEALALHADLMVVREDFDLDEMCGRVQPDFIVYEAPWFQPAPLTITNPRAHPQIPRFGLQIQDPQCATRVAFLRMAEKLDIRWLFSYLPEASFRQAPELAAQTYSLPLLFDENVFKDYGLAKDIPVSVFGGLIVPEIYRWRLETVRELLQEFPTFIFSHPGYTTPVPRHKFAVTGEAYARALNRSHFSVADSTRFDYPVRKHLEIPACGAVLVAPDSPTLRPYGFRDMENCVLGEGRALIEKMAAVADDSEVYERIRLAGYSLVQGKFGRRNWRGLIDFFECVRGLKAGETVRQQGFLGRFYAAPESELASPAVVADYGDSEVSGAIKAWLGKIVRGAGVEELEAEVRAMSDWLPHLNELWLPLGIIALLQGNPARAEEMILSTHSLRQKSTGYDDYDPEEIAWLSLTAALGGNAKLQELTRQQAASMRHLSLRRLLWLGRCLAAGHGLEQPGADVMQRRVDDQISVHWTGQLPIAEWVGLMRRVLVANGQEAAAGVTPETLVARTRDAGFPLSRE